jgi:microcystin-dependent protein
VEGTIGEIRLFAGPVDAATNMVPRGWRVCDGSLLPLELRNFALYAVLGTTYGGDGVGTFALPDLRSRVPVGIGTAAGRPAYTLGQPAGAEQVPTQPVSVGTGGSPGTAVSSVPAASGNNVQPVLALNYIICVQGSFPEDP